VKIEEVLYRMIPFNNVELPKKASVVMPEQTSDVDSYSMSEALGQVEQEVFQILKNITRDLMDGIVKHDPVSENTATTSSTGIDTLKLDGLPVPQSDILVLLVSQKGEAPVNLENPLKIFVAYKADEPSVKGVISQEMTKNGFIDAIVETAKKYTGISTESPLVPEKDGKGNTAPENETGFIVRFPPLSQVLLGGKIVQSMVAEKVESGNPWQSLQLVAPAVGDIARVEGAMIEVPLVENTRKAGIKIEGAPIESARIDGKAAEGSAIEVKAIDGKALLALFRSAGDSKEIFEKLSAFAVGMEKNRPQESAERSLRVEPPYTIVIHIDPAKNNIEMATISPERLSAQEFQNWEGKTTESVINDVMSEAIPVTTFGGQEITKSPITKNITNSTTNTMNIPITNNFTAPADNNEVFKRLALFVDRVNTLFDEERTVEELSVDARSGGEAESMSGKLHLLRLQTRDAGMGPVVQAAVKKIIFENEELQQARIIGLSIEKSNLLRLDRPTLEDALASNKEETLSTLKGFGNSLYERINYFVHPYAGIYADNKEVLQLRASQKDESALLLDKQLNKEQVGLEKRLNELQLLIERSTLLKQWFAEDNATQAEDGA
jgi:hypothetical protein